MIRILHIVGSNASISGVMNFIMNYYRIMNHEKIQFDFLYFIEVEKNFNSEIEKLGGNVYFVNKPSLKHVCRTYKEFDDFFKSNANKYKAVHLHEIYLVNFISHFCKKYDIKHLITHAHTTKYSDNPKNALRNRIMCLGLKHSATDYFACSKAAGEFYYGKEAVESGVVKVIPNAIDLKKYKFNQIIRDKVRKILNIEDKFVIGHIGRMAPPKNQKFLLQIFKEIKKERINSILLMIGNVPLKKEIEAEIKRLNLQGDVILLGVRNDVPNLLMAMDIFVLPSLYEGLPVVCVEAQATGLRCVLSDNITKEVDCGICEFISLKETVEIWCEKILSKANSDSISTINSAFLDTQYSIYAQSKILEKEYFNMKV